MSLLQILYNNMTGNKSVNHGVTGFGVLATGASLALASSRANEAKVKEDLASVKDDLTEIKKGQELLLKVLDSSKKFVNNLDKFSISELFNKTVDYFSNFDILTQALVFNILCSTLLSSLLFSFIFSKFGNALIDKYNLEAKYPKLHFIFKLRSNYQYYYYRYLIILSSLTLLFNLFVNIYSLLSI